MEASTLITFSTFFIKAVQEVIESATRLKINTSETVQLIPNVKIGGDIGSFVCFKGDYEGIMIMNFNGDSAVEIVSAYLKNMGMPDHEIPINHTSDDVRNNIGELVNQIIGKFRIFIESKYHLSSKANIPAVIPISIPIGLLLDNANQEKQQCIRLAFTTPKLFKFYMEVSMEPTKLVKIPTI